MPRHLAAVAIALTLPLGAVGQPRPGDLQRGLVASYPFDGDAVDAVTRARASAFGVRPVDGRDGAPNGALWFDGARALVNLGPSLAPARFTIAAWIRPDTIDRVQVIVSKIRNLPGHWAKNFELRLDPGGRLFLHVPSGGAWNGVQGVRAVAPGRWTHVMAVYDGARAQLYVDGVRDGAPLAGAYEQTRADVVVGARPEGGGQDGRTPSGPTWFFSGSIEDVRVWDRPLSDAEVGSFFAQAQASPGPAPYGAPPPRGSPPPPFPPGGPAPYVPPQGDAPATLLAQYPFDGDAADAMGRADGRLVGTRPAEDRLGNPQGALAFAGRDLVDLGSRTEPERLSIAVWVRPTRAQRDQVIFSKWDPPAGSRPRYLELRLDAAGRAVLSIPNGSRLASVASSRPLRSGQWTHVAATFDGDRAAVYLDGQPAGEAELDGFEPAPGPAFVGVRPDGFGRRARGGAPFDGRLDDLRLYRGSLTADQVALVAREGERPDRGGGDEADFLLVKVDRMLARYDAACVRGDAGALARIESQIVGDLEQAARGASGDRRVAERIRRASGEFGRLRGETDAMSLDRKRSALVELSDALWNDAAQDFDAGPARPRPLPARY